MRAKILTILLVTLSVCAAAQDMNYARFVIDTLTAEGMHGRGYVKKGDSIAAAFIANEYQKFGVKPFDTSFYQYFNINVNAYPDNMSLKINGKELFPGKDFIVHPCSPTFSGTAKAKHLTKDDFDAPANLLEELLHKSSARKIAVVDKNLLDIEKDKQVQYNQSREFLMNSNMILPVAAIEVVDDNLVWFVRNLSCVRPFLIVKADAIEKNIKKISIDIKQEQLKNYQTQNVIGYIPGTKYPDSFYVISAHYDHLGRMGADTYFPGANDDASGVSMLLNLAKHFSQNKPEYSVAIMAFGAEEAGLLGSEHYVKNPLFPLEQIKFMLNLDIVGTGDEGITVVNGSEFKDAFDLLTKINDEKAYLKAVNIRGKAANSDHYHFTEAGVPAFFIYTQGGISEYHNPFDKAATLPLTEYADLMKLLLDFIKSY